LNERAADRCHDAPATTGEQVHFQIGEELTNVAGERVMWIPA
jgi:hypothetical protein